MMKAARIASSVFIALRSPFSRRAVADTVENLQPRVAPAPPAAVCGADCKFLRESIWSPRTNRDGSGRMGAFIELRRRICSDRSDPIWAAGDSNWVEHVEFCFGSGGRSDPPLFRIGPAISARFASAELRAAASCASLLVVRLVGGDRRMPVVGFGEEAAVDDKHHLHEGLVRSARFWWWTDSRRCRGLARLAARAAGRTTAGTCELTDDVGGRHAAAQRTPGRLRVRLVRRELRRPRYLRRPLRRVRLVLVAFGSRSEQQLLLVHLEDVEGAARGDKARAVAARLAVRARSSVSDDGGGGLRVAEQRLVQRGLP